MVNYDASLRYTEKFSSHYDPILSNLHNGDLTNGWPHMSYP